jgi:UDP-N-acetyl-D-glucosamine dehydrogenase
MTLLEKITKRNAKICVIGLGYVGLPLLIQFVKAGYEVIGFDLDEEKIKFLHRGKTYIKHIPNEEVNFLKKNDNFTGTTDYSILKKADCIIICVPTPLGKHHEPDLTYVLNTTSMIAKYLHKEQLVALESTTYPGTMDKEMRPILESTGLRAGKDFYLAFSPEREDPNNKDYSTGTIPKVVGGFTPSCLEVAKALYDSVVVKTVTVSSTRAAEATKLLENIYRSVNIAMINELKMIFDRMDIDIWEVIDAAKTKPFGFQAFYPGPGLGGHCPIDPFYLSWKAREYGFHSKFIELAGEINAHMPYYVVEKVIGALNSKKKTIKSSKVLVLGLAYKKDIDDTRESPSLKIIELLMEKGAHVDFNDPYIAQTKKMRMYDLKKKSVPLTKEALKKYDCVVVATDHTCYDYQFILKHALLVVDTRNAMHGIANNKSVVKA